MRELEASGWAFFGVVVGGGTGTACGQVEELDWVKNVQVTMTAQPPKPLVASQLPPTLAVSEA